MIRRARRIEHDGCKGCSYEKQDEHLEPCLHCDGTKQGDKYKRKTNADRIREMTDEQLAKSRVRAIAVSVDGEPIPGMYEYETSLGGTFPNRKQAESEELKWLQSEVEG